MTVFIANSPPATATKSALAVTRRTGRRVQRNQRASGTNSSALVTFENVTIPINTAATRSPAAPAVHRRPRGIRSLGATSLYNQQKYAKNPPAKLNSSGVIQT